MVAVSTATHAQEEPEYRMELGAGFGLVTYLGDYNSNLVKGMQPWGTLLAKYRLNPRMAVAMDLGTGKVKGSSDNVSTWYPTESYDFNHSLTEVDVRFEYNFWAYGTGQEYRGAKRLTPFITLGLGATFAGIKYKLGQRLNLTAEWVVRFTPSDKIDGRSDTYGIKSGGLFKNSDCYSIIQVGLSYDLWAKCKTCHNDRD